jgi:N-acetylglutamate synthase-like GNAT family acetyltransferase
LAKTLLDEAISVVKERGGKRIYLVARAPGFFRKSGFATIPRDSAPMFFECLTCPQYGVDCHPEVMLMEV